MLSIVVLGSFVVSLFVLPVIAMLGAARQIRESYRVGELMEARYDDSEFELRRSAEFFGAHIRHRCRHRDEQGCLLRGSRIHTT